MSKKEKTIEVPVSSGYTSAYLVHDYHVGNLVGKILTLIESLGLKDTQEKATKDIAREFIYSLYQCNYLPSEAVDAAMEIANKTGCGQNIGGLPTIAPRS